ncbi:hypothetical protein JZ751_016794 [Albula glossodonta]|uniref:Uncharacterized protein n=1 Tax=Albula glossodonta TaxID=121402 RepID=A0A8T2NXN5_9TELE|nr:hypothetical protein JZ751_016794 [Albula glossodonta]
MFVVKIFSKQDGIPPHPPSNRALVMDYRELERLLENERVKTESLRRGHKQHNSRTVWYQNSSHKQHNSRTVWYQNSSHKQHNSRTVWYQNSSHKQHNSLRGPRRLPMEECDVHKDREMETYSRGPGSLCAFVKYPGHRLCYAEGSYSNNPNSPSVGEPARDGKKEQGESERLLLHHVTSV